MPKRTNKRKLTYAQAMLIRNTKHTIKASFWCEHFKISRALVWQVRAGRIYKEPGERHTLIAGGRRYTDQTAATVKWKLAHGASIKEVADAVGLSTTTVQRIKYGTVREDVPWPNGNTGSFKDAYEPEAVERIRERIFANHPGLKERAF